VRFTERKSIAIHLEIKDLPASVTISIFFAVLEIWSREECIDVTTALLSSWLGWLVNVHNINVLKKAISIHRISIRYRIGYNHLLVSWYCMTGTRQVPV
jgi:hypothetical protein